MRHRNRPCDMSGSEIITVLLPYHFGDFNNFKRCYLHFIRVHLQKDFPEALSYSGFVQLEPRCFMPVMFFPNPVCFGRCTGITFADSAKTAVCNGKRIFNHEVFREMAKRGKSTTGRFYGFKPHFVRNDKGGILSFRLTPEKTLTAETPKPLQPRQGNFSENFLPAADICRNRFSKCFSTGEYIPLPVSKAM
jgi:hypothetical protein